MTHHVAVAAVVLAVGFGAGWATNGWRLSAQINDIKAEHAQAVATEQANARAKEQILVTAKHQAEEAHAVTKKQSQRAIAGARSELDRLRDLLATRAASQPAADPAPSAGTDAAACTERELLGEGAGHLAELAAEADRLTATVSGFQGYIRGVCTAPE